MSASIFHRVAGNLRRLTRQLRGMLETDFFASSLKNDEAIMSALESLIRSREKDRERIEQLSGEVAELRGELEKIANGGKPKS